MFLSLYSCREALAHLDDYLDRELSPHEGQLVERHLKICAHCTHKFRFEATLLQGLRDKARRVQLPPELETKIAAQLSALREAKESA
jgi:anti-sigma factor (TIGR02949 family)